MTRWQQWQQGWLARRIPPARQITLSRHNLFILPTRLGWLFLLTLFSIFLLGANYQSNLVLLLAYSMGSLLLVTMQLTHRNLSGLRLAGSSPQLGEVGCPAPLPITLSGHARALVITQNDSQLHLAESHSGVQTLTLALMGARRGRLPLERLRIESCYPLGLFRCWSLLDLELSLWLAPSPLAAPLLDPEGEGEQDVPHVRPAPIGDFHELRPYQRGEPQSRIAWRQLARGRGLLSKRFSEGGGAPDCLTLGRVRGDLEQRLATLAWWCQHLCHEGHPFTLVLEAPQGPDASAAFLRECRWALARYGAA
ncbi:DUF58 domain-containing protein [Aeromonas diversa]|uniref:DUF58 domain-containing protein n=1 Tax=Aeromonas diversa TaxID=502790 RepID=UPI003461C3C2